MRDVILNTPFFGLALSFAAYYTGVYLQRKLKSPLANPLLVAYVIIIAVMLVFKIPVAAYNEGATVINLFLTPITCVLALSVYRQRKTVRDNLVPLLCGTVAGSLTSIFSVLILCKLLGLDDTVVNSMLSKGITTPLALAASEYLGGIKAFTVLAVIITGLSGNILGPLYIKLVKVKDPVTQGIALGTCSHAIGTSRAMEIGETQGALSSVALSFTGIITTLILLIFF